MKTILVSGAGGYIGIPLCIRLINEGYRVIALDRFFFGIDKLEKFKTENLILLKDDIRFFDESILEGVNIVMDLAGLSNDATSEIDPKLTTEINYKGSVRLAKISKKYGVDQYIYSSSASVYGAGSKRALKETDKTNPLTEYAKSKLMVEKELRELSDPYFNITILRNSTVYGLAPRMRFDLAVNIMTLRGWHEGVIYIMGDGKQWRPFVHVQDVVSAFTLCIYNENAYGEIFNVGSNEQNYMVKDLANEISRTLKDTKVIYIPNNPDVRTYNVNFDKINSLIDFKPEWDIKRGVLEIEDALNKGIIKEDDPTCHTLKWYQTLMMYDSIINETKLYGRIL